MDSAADNTQVAMSFVEALSSGDLEGALGLIDENVQWWLAGEPEVLEIAGTKDKPQFAEMLRIIGEGMPNGIHLTITGITTEGERVAVEMDADGVSATGLEYHNHYHDLLVIRNGKIVEGREYLDTAHAARVILGSRKQAMQGAGT